METKGNSTKEVAKKVRKLTHTKNQQKLPLRFREEATKTYRQWTKVSSAVSQENKFNIISRIEHDKTIYCSHFSYQQNTSCKIIVVRWKVQENSPTMESKVY